MKHKNIGGNIRYYRKKINLTQQQLADKVGITWEMISRYERGNSSPMERIEDIASALEIKSTDLLNEPIARNQDIAKTNEIPLFVKLPDSHRFKQEDTTFYYSAPTWMIKKDRGLIAIDCSIVQVKSIRLSNEGVLFVSPNIKPSKEKFVVALRNNELIVDLFENISAKDSVLIGIVIAQEIKLG